VFCVVFVLLNVFLYYFISGRFADSYESAQSNDRAIVVLNLGFDIVSEVWFDVAAFFVISGVIIHAEGLKKQRLTVCCPRCKAGAGF